MPIIDAAFRVVPRPAPFLDAVSWVFIALGGATLALVALCVLAAMSRGGL